MSNVIRKLFVIAVFCFSTQASAATIFEKTDHFSPKGLSIYSKVTISDGGRVDHHHWYTNGTAGVDALIGYDLRAAVILKDSDGNILDIIPKSNLMAYHQINL